jgi:uncharacterized protein YbjT (DUF2867 family)
MRILVLGATGNVGRAVVEAALAGGHAVRAVSRGDTGHVPAECSGDPDRERPDAAGCADHEHGLAAPQTAMIADRLQGRHPGRGDGRGPACG